MGLVYTTRFNLSGLNSIKHFNTEDALAIHFPLSVAFKIGETNSPGIIRLWCISGGELHKINLTVGKMMTVNVHKTCYFKS